jgi:putative membrane protein
MPAARYPRPSGRINAQHQRHVFWLAVLLAALVLWSGFAPRHRQDWILENALVLPALLVLWAIYRRLPFSRLSWTLVFVFLCLHEVGAHYTYSEVPYDAWWHALTGSSFNALVGWDRNNFDRIIHVFYGLLLAYPIREIFLHLAKVRGFWSYFLPLDLTLSSSALYEMIEWAAAEIFGGDLGAAYLGTQGDPWDAQKDMALAAGGALIAMLATALVNWRCQRDFAREWADSLRVEPPEEPPEQTAP